MLSALPPVALSVVDVAVAQPRFTLNAGEYHFGPERATALSVQIGVGSPEVPPTVLERGGLVIDDYVCLRGPFVDGRSNTEHVTPFENGAVHQPLQ